MGFNIRIGPGSQPTGRSKRAKNRTRGSAKAAERLVADKGGLSVYLGGYVDLLGSVVGKDVEAVDEARRLLIVGTLDTPEAAKRAAKGLLSKGT